MTYADKIHSSATWTSSTVPGPFIDPRSLGIRDRLGLVNPASERGPSLVEPEPWLRNPAKPLRFVGHPSVPSSNILAPSGQNFSQPTQSVYVPPNYRDPVEEAAKRFLSTWLAGNVHDAIGLTDWQGISAQLSAWKDMDESSTKEWEMRFLTSWLVKDHGLVNEKGHGDPRAAGYLDLPSSPPGSKESGPYHALTYTQIEDGVEIPTDKDDHYGFIELPSKKSSFCKFVSGVEYAGWGAAYLLSKPPDWGIEMAKHDFPPLISEPNYGDLSEHCRTYGLALRFKRLHHDELFLVFQQKDKEWKVVKMFWVVT